VVGPVLHDFTLQRHASMWQQKQSGDKLSAKEARVQVEPLETVNELAAPWQANVLTFVARIFRRLVAGWKPQHTLWRALLMSRAWSAKQQKISHFRRTSG
jgi:hypothetical protein